MKILPLWPRRCRERWREPERPKRSAVMSMNNQGRPTAPGEANRRRPTAPGTVAPEELATISGDRGLHHEEALIFELGHGAVGVDLPDVKVGEDRLGGLRRKAP